VVWYGGGAGVVWCGGDLVRAGVEVCGWGGGRRCDAAGAAGAAMPVDGGGAVRCDAGPGGEGGEGARAATGREVRRSDGDR